MGAQFRAPLKAPVHHSTIVLERLRWAINWAPIMPRDAVSRTANVERNGGHKWVKVSPHDAERRQSLGQLYA